MAAKYMVLVLGRNTPCFWLPLSMIRPAERFACVPANWSWAVPAAAASQHEGDGACGAALVPLRSEASVPRLARGDV